MRTSLPGQADPRVDRYVPRGGHRQGFHAKLPSERNTTRAETNPGAAIDSPQKDSTPNTGGVLFLMRLFRFIVVFAGAIGNSV